MSHIGYSLTVQHPQGSVSAQFPVEVDPASVRTVKQALAVGETYATALPGKLSVLFLQTDFPCEVTLGVNGAEEIRYSLTGQRNSGRPLAYMPGLGMPWDDAPPIEFNQITVANLARESPKNVTLSLFWACPPPGARE